MKLLTKKPTLALLSMAILTACGGGGGGGDNPKPDPDHNKIFTVETYGDMFTGKPYVLSINNAYREGYEFSARYGELSDVNPLTGEQADAGKLFYYVPESVLGTTSDYYNFKEEFKAVSDEDTVNGELSLGTESGKSDYLFSDQWHIKNIGQNPFSVKKSPSKGKDHNVIPAWHLTDSEDNLISGRNVKVAVFDTRIDFNHEDLKAHKYVPSLVRSYINADLPLADLQKVSDLAHGSAVAGIIGAIANNGVGGRGIAYDSVLTSYDLYTDFPYSDLTVKDDIDIINASMGISNSYAYEPDLDVQVQALLENGIPLVKSMGNEFARIEFYHSSIYPTYCRTSGVNCQFNQTSSWNRGRYFINVGALNSLGVKSSYSSTGSHIWVSGTGGEFGYSSAANSSAAIVTTISSYLPEKYDDWDEGSPWRENQTYYDKRKFYTQRMNGTSSAAPSVTGVIALINQAKPDVTVPQVRYILAKTANNKNTSGWESLDYSPVQKEISEFDDENIVLENGWHKNGAGLWFSNYFGFGVVNAEKAVQKALDCDSDERCEMRKELPSMYKSSGSSPCTSTDGGLNITCSLSGFVNVDDPSDTNAVFEIDNLAINVRSLVFASSTNSVCSDAAGEYESGVAEANAFLQISMTSPSGTEALIKPVYANWDYSGITYRKLRTEPFLIQTSDFFTENVSASDKFTLKIKSMCPLDVSALNSDVFVLIDGYAK